MYTAYSVSSYLIVVLMLTPIPYSPYLAVIIVSAVVIVLILSAVISGVLLIVALKRKRKTELMQ